MSRLGQIVPTKASCILPYHAVVGVSQPNPMVTELTTFRLGSCFDPNEAGIGHQPLGFDQFAALYRRIRVKKVVITGTLTLRTHANDNDVYVFMQADVANKIVVPVAPFDLMQEHGRYKVFKIRSSATANVFGKQSRHFKMTYFPGSIVKKSYPSADNHLGWADFLTNPSYDSDLGAVAEPRIAVYVTDGESRGGGAAFVYIDWTFNFHCEVQDPLVLASS